jgi:hypothetical protein
LGRSRAFLLPAFAGLPIFIDHPLQLASLIRFYQSASVLEVQEFTLSRSGKGIVIAFLTLGGEAEPLSYLACVGVTNILRILPNGCDQFFATCNGLRLRMTPNICPLSRASKSKFTTSI